MNNKKRQENIQRLLEGKPKKHIDHGENIPAWFYIGAAVLLWAIVNMGK